MTDTTNTPKAWKQANTPFSAALRGHSICVDCGKDELDHFRGTGWSLWCDEEATKRFNDGKDHGGRHG